MNKIKCVIVNDKEVVSEILENYIKKMPQLTLVKIFKNSLEALDYLDRTYIHLVFVEIQMSHLNGLELMEKLYEHPSETLPSFILTSEFPEYALSGYEKGAFGYLVKPIVFAKFKITVERIIDTFQSNLHSGSIENDEYFFVESEGARVKMTYRNIAYLECDGNYIKVVEFATELIINNRPMHYMESILSNHGFIRVHKSYIVSIHHMHALRGNEIIMNVIKGQRKIIPVGPTYKNEVQRRIQIA